MPNRVTRYGPPPVDRISRRRFIRSTNDKVQSDRTKPSRVKQVADTNLPFGVRSNWIDPPKASTCKTRCSCFEMFMNVSELATEVQATGARAVVWLAWVLHIRTV